MVEARLATAADAGEVVRLACVMFESIGMEPTADFPAAAAAHFAVRVGRDAVAAVVDRPGGDGLVASAAATTSTRLPTPRNPTGAYAYVQ